MTTHNPPHTAAKTVAITGGARGIGYQTAKELIRRGHRVAIGDIDEARAKETAAELGGLRLSPASMSPTLTRSKTFST